MDSERRRQNQEAFQKFDDFLSLRRLEVPGDEPGVDIRADVLARRGAPWRIGYAAFNLDTAYAANMRRFWTDLAAFDAPETGAAGESGAAGAARGRLLMGTVYADPERSHIGAVSVLADHQPGETLLLGEQGFLASTHSWSEAFRSRDPAMACLGYVYDDIAHYFMADYPNRLIHRLNSDHAPSPAELARARGLIERIVSQRISKYNSQPILTPAMSRGYTRRVLVCDQAFADASTVFGRIDEAGFERMLVAALTENPDAEVLIKTHPDTAWEPDKRSGYYSHLADAGRVRLLRAPLNPFCLFEQVDRVYVGTSQLGLEALFAGKEVVCFGAPFYAGWGLTDDRQVMPHRHRTRSLEEIFHYFYVWYTHYHVPGDPAGVSEIETVLDHIEAHRPTAEPRPRFVASDRPKVSVVVPVHGVERYVEDCLRSIQAQTLQEIEIVAVNDRSPDGSQAIIDRLAAEDPRIRPIVLPQNVGQGFARNAGIEAARGDYIWFLDSDDFMRAPDHLQQVVDCAEADGADMVRGRKLWEQVEDLEGNVLRMVRDRSEIFFDTPFHNQTVVSDPRILRSRHFCNWLYRRSFLQDNGIRFLTANWEERPFFWRALLSAKAISGVPSEAFTYRIRQDSTARRPKTLRDSLNQLANFEQLVDLFEEFGALDPESPLAHAAGYAVAQALHILFFGFAYQTACESGETGTRTAFLDRVAAALERCGMDHDALVFEASQISRERLGRQVYRLLFEALRTRRYDHVDIAVEERPLPQAKVMAELLREPGDPRAAAFQVALSLYARNERIVTAEGLAPPAGKPRLVIHIGQTKTGSTHLQHFLEQNRPALLRRGVLVPDKGLFWQPARPHKQAGHSEFTREAVTGGSALRDHVEAALALAGGRIHTVILSSEAFFLNPRAALIPEHFAGWPCEMIGYFRRQDDWANSQYAEFVAGGAMGRVAQPFGDWLDDPVTRERLDYLGCCQLWAAAIGPQNLHVRPYDRTLLAQGDVVSDFLATLGLSDCDGLPRPGARLRNDSPFNAAHVALLRDANAWEWPDREAYLAFIEEVSERIAALGSAAPPGGAARIITLAQRRRLMAGLAASNAAFTRDFCPEAAALFEAPATEGPDPEAGNQVSQAEIAAIQDALAAQDAGRHLPPGSQAAGREPKRRPETREELTGLRGILVDAAAVPERLAAGSETGIEALVFNLSQASLPPDLPGAPAALSYHWRHASGGMAVWNGARSPLPGPVDTQLRAPLRIEAPAAPGRYLLQVAVVVEGLKWFDGPRLHPVEVV